MARVLCRLYVRQMDLMNHRRAGFVVEPDHQCQDAIEVEHVVGPAKVLVGPVERRSVIFVDDRGNETHHTSDLVVN